MKKIESSYKKKVDTIFNDYDTYKVKVDTIFNDYDTYKATYEKTCKDGILIKIKKGSFGHVPLLGKDIPVKDVQMSLKIPCK